MKRLIRWLTAILLIELVGALGVVVWRVSRPAAPIPEMSRLDDQTAAALRDLAADVWRDTALKWRELGEAYMAFGYFPEAELCLSRAAKKDPTDARALVDWGMCLERMGRMQEAIERFQQAAPLAEEALARTCWYHVGRNRLRLERPQEAEQAFEYAGELIPALYQRGKLMVRSGRPKEALAVARLILQIMPRDLWAMFLAYRAELEMQHEIEAAEWEDRLRRSTREVNLDDYMDFFNPIRNQYGLVKRLGELDKAVKQEDWPRVAELGRSLLDALPRSFHWRLVPVTAKAELHHGRADAAISLLEPFIADGVDSPEPLETLAAALFEAGQTRRAVEFWQQALRLKPTIAAHEGLAQAYEKLGETALAQRHRGLAAFRSGLETFRNDQLTEALPPLQKAAELLPDHAGPWLYLGEIHRALGDSAKAAEAYRKCLSLAPGTGRAHRGLKLLAATEGEKAP